MHPTTLLRARWHRAAGHHIVNGRAPSAAEISAALGRSMRRAAEGAGDARHCAGCTCGGRASGGALTPGEAAA